MLTASDERNSGRLKTTSNHLGVKPLGGKERALRAPNADGTTTIMGIAVDQPADAATEGGHLSPTATALL